MSRPMEKDYLTLKRASASRPSGEWNDDDFDVLADGAVVGRIFKVHAAPVGTPWMWTLAFGHHEARTPSHTGTRPCCARAASGHVAAAPPSSVMNSRRFNRSNCIRSRQPGPNNSISNWRGAVRSYLASGLSVISPILVRLARDR
jgi:hypothetical protein